MLGLYKALYDYEPQDPETELALTEDQAIYILDKEDPEWWKARAKPADGSAAEDGPVGLVPSNYVEEAAPLYRARAIYAYTASTAEELSIEEDEPLLIFEADEGDEWVLARRVAEPEQLGGYVPATYVQEEEGTAGEEGFNGDAVDEIEGPPQATYVDPAELSAERRDKGKADSIETWVVSELDGKKKKTKGTLGIGNGAIFFASESSKNPIQQHPIDEVEAVSLSGKDVSLDLPALGGRPWAFHCASSSEAEAVHAKLHASKDASGGSFSAGAGRDVAEDDEDDRMGGLSVNTGGASSSTKAVRWAPSPTSPAAAPAGDDDEEAAVALYDFAAEGGADELVLTEGERLVVVDKSGDGWWKVRNSRGEEGVVPEAYVELGAGGAADDDDDNQREDEERAAAAAEAEAAAIAAANAERAQAEAERRRQMEERRARQEAEEKRRRKDEERARRDEEARQREEARRQAPAPEPPKIRSRPSMNDVPTSIPHKSGLPSRPQESSSSRSLPAPNRVRTWHDKSGQFKVEAEFLGFKGGKIRLHKVNGVVIEVPLAKMSPEDSEYIDRLTAKQQQRRRPADDDDVPLAQSQSHKARPTVSLQPQSQGRSAVASAPSGRPPTQQQRRRPTFDWFEFFLNAGVDVDDCTRYAANFDRDKIDETILDDLDPGTLRNLGLREGDVIRVKKAIAARKAPPPPAAGGGDPRSQIESDEAFARRLQEEENGRRGGGTSSPAPAGGSGGGSGLFTSSTGELKNQTRRGRPERKGTASDSVDASSLAAASSSIQRTETPPAVAVSPPAPVNPPQRTTSAAAAPPPAPAPVSNGFDDDAWTPRPSSTKPATPTPPTAPVAPSLVSFDSAQAVPQAASSAFESLAQPGQARPPPASVQQPLNTGMSNLSIGSNNTGSSSMQAPQSFHNGLGFGGSNTNMGQLLQAQQTGMFQQQGPRAPPAPVPSNQGLLNPLVPTQTGFGQFVPTRSSANSSPFQGMQPQQTGFMPQQQTGFMPQQQTGYPSGGFQSTPSFLPPQHTAMNTNYQAGQVMANQSALSSADTFNQLASARPQAPPSAAQPASFNPSSVFAAMKNNKGVLDQSAAPQGSDKYDALRPQTTGFPGMMQQPQMTGYQQQQPQMGFMQAQQTGFPMQQQMPTGMPMQPSFMGPQPTGFMPQQQTGFNPYGQQQQQQGGYRGF